MSAMFSRCFAQLGGYGTKKKLFAYLAQTTNDFSVIADVICQTQCIIDS